MGEAPKVAVIVTCYNLGRYLDEAIDSVLAQTLDAVEIVVVDDGSTDPETKARLDGYDRPKTRVRRIENRGLPGARNVGIRATTAPYLCMLDADDVLEPTYFEKAVAMLEADSSIAIVSPWYRAFGEEDWEFKPEDPEALGFPALLDTVTLAGVSLVRRDAVEAVGLYDESMRDGLEDWDLWLRLVARGFRPRGLPEVLFFYRQRRGSMSRLMMESDAYPRIGARVVELYRELFDEHAVAFLLRREVDRVTALRESHDLELDCESVLRPAIDRLRDDLRVATRKLERIHLEEEPARAAAEAREAERSLAELRERHEAREGELAELRARHEAREGELATLREQDAARERALADLRGRHEAREGELSARLEALESARRRDLDRLDSLQAEQRREREGIAGLKSEIRALRGSLSWRLTRPLRAVYSWIFERGTA